MLSTGVRQFVQEHIDDVAAILDTLIGARLTLSGEKSYFGRRKVTTVGNVCSSDGREPEKRKVDALAMMESCTSTTEVRRFLGALGEYRRWIPHFGQIAKPVRVIVLSF